ncbi:hypothetical protein HanIR_Chr06g0292701 [Helianthus annuus]|nr:hypothetical protein HanIR_Chr06g0292701 [Helianthus annuus]
MPCFKYCNSRSPLSFSIDLSLITYVRALPTKLLEFGLGHRDKVKLEVLYLPRVQYIFF